jgi:hypothetical protein
VTRLSVRLSVSDLQGFFTYNTVVKQAW